MSNLMITKDGELRTNGDTYEVKLVVRLQPGERKPYMIRRQHGNYPAGTPCVASRPYDDDILRLEFEDGGVIEVRGYAVGIERYDFSKVHERLK
jgi:hypothetical protein